MQIHPSLGDLTGGWLVQTKQQFRNTFINSSHIVTGKLAHHPVWRAAKGHVAGAFLDEIGHLFAWPKVCELQVMIWILSAGVCDMNNKTDVCLIRGYIHFLHSKYLYYSFFGDQNVGTFDITMHNPVAMEIMQTIQDLACVFTEAERKDVNVTAKGQLIMEYYKWSVCNTPSFPSLRLSLWLISFNACLLSVSSRGSFGKTPELKWHGVRRISATI